MSIVCAICKNDTGEVINTVVCSPDDQCPVDDCHLVQVPDGVFVSTGSIWTGTEFKDDRPTVIIPDENGEI
jgi:hypothetical protein